MLTFALGSLAKGTLLLLLGVLADRVLRRRGPDVRHAALAIALLGALLVPLLSIVLPSWRAPVSWLAPAAVASSAPNEAPPVSASPLPHMDAVATARRVASGQQESAGIDAIIIAVFIWGAGALCVVIFLACGELAMLRVRRRARAAESASWHPLVRQTAGAVGAPPNVAVLLSSDISVPLTCGLLRPAVLLPCSAEQWTDERKRVVLVHELSHVRRHDATIELAAWVACAVYWFHPLAWLVARRLRLQRELACDESVVRTTGDSLGYARQLVDIAAAARGPQVHGVAALAMAAGSSLEVRVRSLLRKERAGQASAKTLVRLALVGATGVIGISVLDPTQAQSRPQTLAPRDTLEWPIAPDALVEWSGAVQTGDTVSVRAAMGSIVIDSGPAGAVTLSARRKVGPRGVDAETRVSVMQSGRTIMICSVHFYAGRRVAPCEVNDDWGRGSVDDNAVSFHVAVPAGVHVALMSGLGDLTTNALRGNVRALTGNGDATIETDGAANVEAYTGRIALRVLPGERDWPLDLRVKHGNIDVEAPPNGLAIVVADVDTGMVFVDGDARPTKGNLGFVGINRGRRLHVAAQKGMVSINTRGR